MRMLKALLGLGKKSETSSAAPDELEEIVAEAVEVITPDDPRIAEGHAILQAHWDAIGVSDRDFITYLVNPQFQGAPAWPNTRQAYRILRREGSLILASDGMSDPFVGTDTDESGFGMEVWIEVPGLQTASFEEIRASWAFQIIEMVAQNVADHGGLVSQFERYGALSMALPGIEDLPAGWRDADGMAGVLIGLPTPYPEQRELPFGAVRLLAVTLLHPDELAIAMQGRSAREAIADQLAAETGHMSSTGRMPVSIGDDKDA